MKNTFKLLLIIICSAIASSPALATTGPGCLWVVNVKKDSALRIRSEPNASSRIIGQLVPEQHGIIVLRGKCEPLKQPYGNRWCPITSYDNDQVTNGWVSARYVKDNDCP